MYCFNCMREADARAVCPHCHKQNVPDRIVHHLAPGTVLNGHYIVGNSLGEGGFGITYAGRDTKLQMRVAIKEYYPLGNANRNNSQTNEVYTTTDAQSEAFEKGKESFLREARSIARFSGAKGVVNIKTYFEEYNTAYIIMDYLEGENLLQYINNHGNFAADELFRLMLPVMESLQAIHSESVIHRDISPDNIIYGSDGALTLTDFGSARYFTSRNNEMSVMLKQGYAPEEQYRATGDQGPWTDVYGLCATIYKCITGTTPQSGLDRAHYDTLKKPSDLGAKISPALESVLMYGLSVFRNDRCQSMSELIDLTKTAFEKGVVPTEKINNLNENKTVSANDSNYLPNPIDNQKLTYGDSYVKNAQKPHPEFQRNEPPQKQSKGPIIAAVSIAAAAVILAVVILVILLGKSNDSDNDNSDNQTTATISSTEEKAAAEVTVPNLSGKTRAEAQKLLEDANLDYEMTNKETEKLDEENKVIEQSPKAGEKVREGDKVTLYIGEYKEKETEEQTEKPTDPKTILYCCASDYATLRDEPSKSGNELQKIKSREPVEYLDTVNDFYKVKYNGNTGYVWKVCFSPDINAPLYTGTGNDYSQSSQAPASISSPSKYMYCIASKEASFRTKPTSLNGDFVICQIPSGAKVKYYSSCYGELITHDGKTFYDVYADDKNREFYKVEYNGMTGYVIGKFFSSDPNADIISDNW